MPAIFSRTGPAYKLQKIDLHLISFNNYSTTKIRLKLELKKEFVIYKWGFHAVDARLIYG